ncbi:MAG: alpha/beta hydrolase [Bdellovibrionaceae bacterium]|nr:alpha/beta hydrolase [Pseudobdellovibrionaceae bacterium]
MQTKKDIAFINGSHLDENSWFEVIRILGSEKYNAVALPRLGRDDDGPAHISNMAKLSCEKLSGPTIMIVHSFGGAIVNSMIGICPEKISKVIYISALVPLKGEKPMDLLKGVDQKLFMSAVKIEKSRIVPKSQKKLLMVLDSGINPNSLILPNTYSESTTPGGDVLDFDGEKFQKIPKYYIFTEADQIIPLAIQKKYVERVNILGTRSVNSGHLPMISQPEELAKAIEALLSADL